MLYPDEWERLRGGPSSEQPATRAEIEPQTQTEPGSLLPQRPGRVHLVVVVTRAFDAPSSASRHSLISRFWHPRDRRWRENMFESLEHALHLFVDESGWVLRQQQPLDAPLAFELIFEARREDFSRPSTEALLEEAGFTPEDAKDLISGVDREPE
ncbi:MAG TPA: hypothetical protein VH763_09270 [Gemmatimonadales bacterium]